ncbi:MAG: cell division protein FtsL [Negativicutes bacterium]|nr:cell division protein FtsL [Negativicutes bacterium]
MLVNKKQDWELYQTTTATPAPAPAPRTILRARPEPRLKCLITIAVIAVMAMLVTLQSASIVKAGYELVQIKAQMAKMEKENEQLRLDIAKMKSPQRIQAIATQELGMIVPKTVYHASTAAVSAAEGVQSKVTTASRTNLFAVNKAEASVRR